MLPLNFRGGKPESSQAPCQRQAPSMFRPCALLLLITGQAGFRWQSLRKKSAFVEPRLGEPRLESRDWRAATVRERFFLPAP